MRGLLLAVVYGLSDCHPASRDILAFGRGPGRGGRGEEIALRPLEFPRRPLSGYQSLIKLARSRPRRANNRMPAQTRAKSFKRRFQGLLLRLDWAGR